MCLGLVFGLAVLLSAGLAVLRSPWFEDWLTERVRVEVARATHEQVQLGRARVMLWPPGVGLTELEIRDDATDRELVRVAEIRAPVALGMDGPRIGVVSVAQPRVSLDLDEQGRLLAFQRPADAPPAAPLRRLPLDGLTLEEGTFQLRFPDGFLAIDDLQILREAGRQRVRGQVDIAWRQFSDQAVLDIGGIAIEPTRIHIPDARVELDALRVGGPIDVPLAGPLDAHLALHSDLRELSPLLTGPRFLLGEASGDLHLAGPFDALAARAELRADGFAYDAPGKVWPRIRYGVDQVRVKATADRDGIEIAELEVEEAGGQVSASGRIEAIVQPDGSTRWELMESEILGDSLSLASLLQAFSAAPHPWVDFDGQAHAHLAGPLAPLELTGPVHATLSDFTVRQGPVEDAASVSMLDIPHATLDGTVTVYADHLLLDAQDLRTGNNRGRVLADIGFGPQGPLDLSFDLEQADLGILRPLGGSELKGRGRMTGRLWGDFASLQARGRGVLKGFAVGGIPYADRLEATIATPDMKRLVLEQAIGRRGRTVYTGDFEMDFARSGLPIDTTVQLVDGRVEDLVGMFLDLGEVVTGELRTGELHLEGPLNDLNGEADLVLGPTQLVGERFEQGRARGRMHDGTFSLDEITVRRGDSDRLTLTGDVDRAWALDLRGRGQLALEDLDALGDLDTMISGVAIAEITIDNTLFDPAPAGGLRLTQVIAGGRAVPDSQVRAETVDGILHVHGDLVGDAINVDFDQELWGEQHYELAASFEAFPLHLAYPVAADGSPVEATFSGDLELWGSFGERWSEPELRIEIPEVSVAWREHRLRAYADRPWRFASTGRSWTLSDLGLTGGESTLTLSGSGRPEGTLLSGEGLIDAALLPAIVPGLTRSEGSVDVRVATGGPAGAVRTHVDLVLDVPLMRHDGLPSALEDVKARAVLTPDAFLLTHFQAQVGGGRLFGDASRSRRLSAELADGAGLHPVGIIEAEGWVPVRYDLLGRAEDVQMQWVEDLPPAVGDADLAFDGPADNLLLHADIIVRDMAFTQRIDWEDWVVALEDYLLVEAPPTDEAPWFGLDIDIVADRTIRLLNNVSDATASADLKLMGDTSRMGLVGAVWVEDGVVYVQDRAFQVERGELRFDDPFSWDPLLDFDLQADLRSRARQYRVNYRITGPYSAWTSSTESEPRLPQADVNALLWFGVTADDLEDMGELTNAVGLAAADFVVKDFVQNDYLGLGLQDNEILNRLPAFDLNTGVNLRGEYSSEPRLLIDQRWSPTLSTQAEINLVRDDHFVRFDWRTEESLLLSAWYASRRREGFILPINGAVGVDLRWVMELGD